MIDPVVCRRPDDLTLLPVAGIIKYQKIQIIVINVSWNELDHTFDLIQVEWVRINFTVEKISLFVHGDIAKLAAIH